MHSPLLDNISVIAEMERCGISYRFVGDDELQCACPFHDDDTPSCSVSVSKRVYACHAAGCGNAKGDFITFLAGALKTTRKLIVADLEKRYGAAGAKYISPVYVERCHAAIWEAKPMLRELRERGLSDESIRRWRLGYAGGRITIPIADENGNYVNVRKYLPGAPGSEKMRNTSGCGRIRLYPINQLSYQQIVLCGGEIKALSVAERLNDHKIGAITTTGGEGKWSPAFNAAVRGKKLWIMMDIDAAGRQAAERLCQLLRGIAAWVGRVDLPLDPGKYPTGDINDWLGKEHHTAEELASLLASTPEWSPVEKEEGVDEPTSVVLSQITNAEWTGKRISTTAVISAADISPYVIPAVTRCHCDKNQDFCGSCPVYARESDEKGGVTLRIHPESIGILEMVGAPKKSQRQAMMSALRMPPCKTVTFAPVEWQNVEDVRLSPKLEITSEVEDRTMLPAMCVGGRVESNVSYQLIGRMYPHPQTQQSILVVSQAHPIENSVKTYRPSREDLESLCVFKPKHWSVDAIDQKLAEVYDDLSANVTRIYKRQELHIAVDLAYHSPLVMRFDGKLIKGWVEILIIGDTAQGKSEVTTQMKAHYGLGERVDCKNATVAGLLGGLQQIGNRWFVTWGVIPTHDSRLVILDELKGASTEVLSKLTDMRSTGVAEIPKIEKRRTHARTRLIAASNPRNDLSMRSFNYGVESVKHLIGGPEDVRRFDAVFIVTSADVPATELNALQSHRPTVTHVFTAELCRKLVLWAWSRSPDNVTFEDVAVERVLKSASAMCEEYSDVIPIVDAGSMRYKIARLSASIACRTFSADESGMSVIVRPGHVEWVVKTLRSHYSSSSFGYLDFSKSIAESSKMSDVDAVRTAVLRTPWPKDFAKHMLYAGEIELRDICDWCGWERSDGIELLSTLVRKRALIRDGRAYRKSPEFIALLKKVIDSDVMHLLDRPKHVEDF